jgi:hypothetical protein
MSTKVTTQLDFSTAGSGIINLTDPTAAQDAATKAYVDAVAQGLKPKDSVRLATAAALPANTYANGASGIGATLTANAFGALSVDGVAVSVNDRIIVKNEAAAANNGIYTVSATGSGAANYVLVRAVDFDKGSEIPGSFSFVELGGQGGSVWVCSNTTAPTLGSTSITFTQLSGPGTITGSGGITVTGNNVTLDVPVTIARGGTSQTTAVAARGTSGVGAPAVAPSGAGSGGIVSLSALGVSIGVTALIGDAVTTSFAIHHNLGTKNVIVQVFDHTSGLDVITDVTRTSTDIVTVAFSSAPAASGYDVVIIAAGV